MARGKPGARRRAQVLAEHLVNLLAGPRTRTGRGSLVAAVLGPLRTGRTGNRLPVALVYVEGEALRLLLLAFRGRVQDRDVVVAVSLLIEKHRAVRAQPGDGQETAMQIGRRLWFAWSVNFVWG